MDPRKVEVKTALTVEEFMAFKALTESKGVSQASFLRMYIKDSIVKHCAEQAPNALDLEPAGNWTGNVQPFDMRIANR